MPDALHERSDKEIRDKLSSGEISDKKASTARAILRRRRQERWQAWFKRHEWLATLLTALGLAGIFFYSALRFRRGVRVATYSNVRTGFATAPTGSAIEHVLVGVTSKARVGFPNYLRLGPMTEP